MLPCGDDDDCFGILFHARTDGGTADGLGGGGWPGSKETNLVEQVGVEDGLFCQEDCLGHETDRLDGIRSLCCFSRKHDAICTVENSVADVRDFSTSRTGIVCHGLQHLSGTTIKYTLSHNKYQMTG